MKNIKKETFVYEGLGFPVLLVNASLRKTLGEWVIDIDFNKLRKKALEPVAKLLCPEKSMILKASSQVAAMLPWSIRRGQP
jgi:hypothetical protein